MRKKIILSALLIAASFTAFAQAGIGTTTPEGALDVVSSDSGVVLPRVANTAAVTNPVNGMLIYDLTSTCIKAYENGDWSGCLSTGSGTSPGGGGGTGTSVVEVTSPTGAIWMDRNLGATQAATSSTDAASYGDLYQWGRTSDGHQLGTSSVTAGPVAAGSEGSNFITNGTTPYDWLSTQDDTRWGAAKTANDPCPIGYRVPTEAELNAERLLFPTNGSAGAYASELKFPVAGYRSSSAGAITLAGTYGRYWSSTVLGTSARRLTFTSSSADMNSSNRAFGLSVRCIKE